MLRLFNSSQLILERPYSQRWLTIRRTEATWGSMETLARVWQQAFAVLQRADKARFGLLIDLRRVPINQERQFEKAMGEVLVTLPVFRRTAILVNTAVGQIQVGRHIKLHRMRAEVFMSEDEATAYLDSP